MNILSIVVPCYNEQEVLPLFYASLCDAARQLPELQFEILLVNDGSRDGTLQVMKQLAETDQRVKYLSFSRNFGKEAAMLAGFEHATGNYIAIMDADGQDPPSMLGEMYHRLEAGQVDCVATRRVDRKGEPPIRSFFARIFYRIMARISKTEIVDGARDYRMMTRQMLDAILSMGEYNRFSKGIFGWVGFETEWLEYVNIERMAGETKWSFWKLLVYSIDGIVAFSTAPLAISSLLGFIFCLTAFVMIIVIIAKTLLWGDPVGGWPSQTSIILLVGGLQLFSIGVLGQYLAKTYLETKGRPPYILKETNASPYHDGGSASTNG